MKPHTGIELTDRAREILQWAISTYVVTGKPVGSRKVARRSREHLSPATVRNIMADLEEMGFLTQPHPSAGRVPTDLGYRLYVDSMLQKHEIPPVERSEIERSLAAEDNTEHLMARASRVLSAASKNLGIVVSPAISRVALQHIQFVGLPDSRILVILVSRSGIVQNRIIRPASAFSATDLHQAGRYITEHFKDRTLMEIKAMIHRMILEEKALYDRFMHSVILLSTQTFADAEEDGLADVYVEGASNLIRNPEFSDTTRMRMLFETIEQKSKLATLISECIQGDTQEVRITIGAENALSGIEDCTLITSRFSVDEETHGSLGILGPTRMEYARAISLVEYVAGLFGRVLANQGKRE